ncbi:DUF4435 domain-containing protein [Bradyrhizobium symbiodeficiens]|uniref:DUF4435 domain-containing protein n=1 Tax=Bradyrhizobium symbiodeficiens TaxID=1404367 RepID=A0A6G9A0C7_9BRAD|nr:DUF4435 domain-containing protein [Bradyrhizobium symbiodeficiens]QIP05776.1 DUF4435 domain-containing protein [Bradyrhizobium symbiodeficiens]
MAKYSIVNEIDGGTVAGEIAALQADSPKAILVVEGSSDERFFNQFRNEASCSIVISAGWENAIDGLMIVRANGRVGVLVVLDLDYRAVLQNVIVDPDIVFTREHDLEMAMTASPAFEKVLYELGSQPKIVAFMETGKSPRQLISDIARPIGALRLYAQEKRIALDFDEYDYRHLTIRMDFDFDDFVRMIFARSKIAVQTCPDLQVSVADKINNIPDQHLCCGHDVCAVLGRSLQSTLGSQNARFVTGELIERNLRLAYGAEEFVQSGLYQDIKGWEARNAPYLILRI